MKKETKDPETILNSFLERWGKSDVQKLTLDKYVSLGDPDTFCQWIESRTRILGSISGLIGSIKFGIYKRNNKIGSKKYDNDEKFSWQKSLQASSRHEAFYIIKEELLSIIDAAFDGDLERIDKSQLYDIYKWKVAYLYSNDRIIPIFSRKVLEKIAKHFKIPSSKHLKYSTVQRAMIANKPSHLSFREYSSYLWRTFKNEKEIKKTNIKGRRKAVEKKNTSLQQRKGSESYIATQKHNELQNKLEEILVKKYGRGKVLLEENNVDIKVILDDEILFYEVKSDSCVSECIRKGLGQILSYSYLDKDPRPKKLIIVGPFGPNEDETEFISFLKKKIKFDFEYQVGIKNT